MLARWVYIAWGALIRWFLNGVLDPGRRQVERLLCPSYGGAAFLPCFTLSCLALPCFALSHPCLIIAPLPCLRILYGDRQGKTHATLPPRYKILVSCIIKNENTCLRKSVSSRNSDHSIDINLWNVKKKRGTQSIYTSIYIFFF